MTNERELPEADEAPQVQPDPEPASHSDADESPNLPEEADAVVGPDDAPASPEG